MHAKARPVLLGFQDPDLAKLDQKSPVCTRAAFFLLLQLAASFNWVLAAADATAAATPAAASARLVETRTFIQHQLKERKFSKLGMGS